MTFNFKTINYMLKMIAIQCTTIRMICQDCSANKALIIMADTLAIYKKHVVGYKFQAVVTEVIVSVA